MITIDGSYGEGGGQILRTSLALSIVTGIPFKIENIRAGRRKSGLMRQHLTAVNAAAEISNGKVTGNNIGSKSFTFKPDKVKAGNYKFSIGSAGSCTLVLQTILPALMVADAPSELILEGGTHNPYAPPFDFLEKSFLKTINKMGPQISIELIRPGFYPAGGGKFKVIIDPAGSLKKIDISQKGKIINYMASAVVSNLPVNIAKRELKIITKELGWGKDCLNIVEIKNPKGPGNIVVLEIKSENITEVFTGFGEKGTRAETVAKRAAGQAKKYLETNVPVGRYLADQLLVPMSMAGGGKFRTMAPTKHTLTNIEMIKKFLDVRIEINEHQPDLWEIEIKK